MAYIHHALVWGTWVILGVGIWPGQRSDPVDIQRICPYEESTTIPAPEKCYVRTSNIVVRYAILSCSLAVYLINSARAFSKISPFEIVSLAIFTGMIVEIIYIKIS
eukprot:878790_1